MKIALLVLLSLMAMAALVAAIGSCLPEKHRAQRGIRLRASASSVWKAISDVESYPQWRKELVSVERTEVEPGQAAWLEEDRRGHSIAYITVDPVQGKRLVRKIVGKDLPFGGTWTFEIEELGKESELTITEDAEVYNPIFRFVSRFLMGHHRSLDRYLEDLKIHLGA